MLVKCNIHKQKIELKLIETMQTKSATFFMVPFYYSANNTVPNSSIWELRKKSFVKEKDVLFPYIMDTILGQTYSDEEREKLGVRCLKIYQLNQTDNKWDGGKGSFWTKIWIPFARKKQTTTVDGKEITFHYSTKGNIESPHLFVSEEAKIGVMTFLVETDSSVEDLVLLNYALHKTDESFGPCCYQNSTHCGASQSEEELCRVITGVDNYSWSAGAIIEWKMRQVVNLMLQGNANGGDTFFPFSNIRMHLLTYHITNGTEAGCSTYSSIIKHVSYLSHCCKSSYSLPLQQIESDGMILKTFDNIYIGTSVEGCSIMAIAEPKNESFTETFYSIIQGRYFWIYLLVVLQRYTMFNIIRQLVEIEAQNDNERLWQLLDTYKHLKTTCFWGDVSPYVQHTQFYHHCCKGMRVNELFDEIDRKTTSIRLITEHNVQKLLDQQQRNEKAQEKKNRDREIRLGLLVAIMTVAQVAGATYEIFEHSFMRLWLTIGATVASILAIFIIWKSHSGGTFPE